ncbi:MAG: hypothetical protein J6Q39_13005 [Bacteroidales bacterium]|nr:hypothetical protein [Bacteroidales bacterium]
MDYIRISHRVTESPSHQGSVAEPVEVLTAHSSQLTAKEVKELLKDWIKLYPNSFAPDVDFKIYQLADGDIIIQLHEDLSSMAVSLLVLYFENISQQVTKSPRHQGLVDEHVEAPIANSQQPTAYITIDDTEILLKQNEGKRAMVFCSHQVTKSPRHQGSVTEPVEVPTANSQQTSSTTQQLSNSAAQQLNNQQPTAVRFLLEDNYVLDYNFEKRPQPVKESGLQFNEPEFVLPETYESVMVGDVVKKKIDEALEEGLTPTKLLIYFLCGAIGLSIGFLIVYFMGK